MTAHRSRGWVAAACLLVTAALGGCGSAPTDRADPMSGMPGMAAPTVAAGGGLDESPLPGMPPPLATDDIYAADRPNALAPAVAGDIARIYVPNHTSNTVSVINPTTHAVVRTVAVPAGPEHVVPSYDLKTLWVNSDVGNALTPIDARTGHFGKPIAVNDPYNLYFTPDGRYAVVMSEAAHQIVFRDPHTMAIRKVLPVNCGGVNHADFSANGRYFIVSCEFSGDLLKVDTERQRVVAQLHLPKPMAMPQDVKVSPDGKTWYIADMQSSGVWILHDDRFADPTFLPTGAGAHGLYVSRDSRHLYVTNRGAGTISVLDFATNTISATWTIPGGGTPDMGGLSADGTVLWVSGRYDHVVYAISTVTGRLLHRITVGTEPHGLCVWPQPGRYSLGHTGILR
ncbi:MAG TPA: YncE family protein [Micromonosporaceae bacterium]|jgi:YVTN family beta-propeller protein